MSYRGSRLKTFRKSARLAMKGMPLRAYKTLPNGVIIAVDSVRAEYLRLKKLFKQETNNE